MSDTIASQPARSASQTFFRQVMMMLAVLFVVIGVALGVVGGTMGLTADEVRDIASLFLIVGSIDTLIVWYWDRLFPDRG